MSDDQRAVFSIHNSDQAVVENILFDDIRVENANQVNGHKLPLGPSRLPTNPVDLTLSYPRERAPKLVLSWDAYSKCGFLPNGSSVDRLTINNPSVKSYPFVNS